MTISSKGIIIMICNTLIDPNMEDNHGRNALHLACNNFANIDITEMVKLLIQRYITVFNGTKCILIF